MKKWICMLAISLILMEILFTSSVLAGTTVGDKVIHRKRRFLFFDFDLFGSQCGGPGDCPPHHCSMNEAVIHGYCCGCARFTDRVPIPCSPFIRCPLRPEPLCSDYNYMMDCCC
ncbi:uncharacterized protein [Periplaneta americana]|uniref:uncharacterized protein n=1 Tax=Periplaneta americana TaxID=6978 RepID=UPI0037E72520